MSETTQNPRKRFPGWHLPKGGTPKATDDDLEVSIESCERWESLGGVLVVLGVAATVAIAAFHPEYNSVWERWGSAVADSLVAVGVVSEIKFGRMAGLRHKELERRSKERAAAAEKRAVELEFELIRLKQPRQIDTMKFVEFLIGSPACKVDIFFVRDASDAQNLAIQIFGALCAAKWEATFPLPLTDGISSRIPKQVAPMLPLALLAGGQTTGVSIVWRDAPQVHAKKSRPPFASSEEALYAAIKSCLGQVGGGTDETLARDTLRIVVAAKL